MHLVMFDIDGTLTRSNDLDDSLPICPIKTFPMLFPMMR
jgi:hypothetical protein